MKYELTLTVRQDNNDFVDYEKIESKDLIELTSKFCLVIAKATKKEIDKIKISHIPDDIPF